MCVMSGVGDRGGHMRECGVPLAAEDTQARANDLLFMNPRP